jgi:hypothetical protein
MMAQPKSSFSPVRHSRFEHHTNGKTLPSRSLFGDFHKEKGEKGGMSYYGRSDNRMGDSSSFRDGGNRFGGGSGGDSMVNLGANLKNIDWDLSSLPVFEKNFYIGR